MKIGFVYDLRDDYLAAGHDPEATAELDSVDTIDAIVEVLEGLGHEVERVGALDALVRRLAAGARWDLVFNIAEGLYGYGREAAVPALLDAWRIPYTFSDPLALTSTLHKGVAKELLATRGVATANFSVYASPADLERLDGPLPGFAKPIAEGTGKGIGGASVVRDRAALEATVCHLLEAYHQPVIVERYLEGPEVTVGIVGTGEDARVVGVLEVNVIAGRVYGYETKQDWEDVVRYRLASPETAARAGALALRAWRTMECRDGGRVDLKSDADGAWYVLELNPLAGLNPHHSDLPIMCRLAGLEYRELIAAIVESAAKRL